MRRRGWLGAGLVTGAALAGLAVTSRSLLPLTSTLSIAPGGPAPASAPAADDGATVVGERRRGERVLDLAVRSPVLPDVARVRLLLPPGWRRGSARAWPVLWLLHGMRGDHGSWTDHTDVEQLTADLDVLVVMPDGGACGLHTDWWNGGAGGPPSWETFHLTELRQILERGYGAGTARAVAGAGHGGLGALAYAARHRGLFRAAASFSGPLHTLHNDPGGLDVSDLVELAVTIGSRGADWTDVWGDPVEQRIVWRQHNPYDLADRLAGVRLHVASGDGAPGPFDPLPAPGPDVLEGLSRLLSGEFAGKLKKLGIPVSTHFYRGTQGWAYWQRELRAALPLLVAEIT
ncbi:alpha/beta hydrolase [Actinomadura oligospora]|uniref:alpha/beta hydrolase n=1 Tax=Actinomadura oligospora TaxID=111804 RepID=UPI0004AD1C5C|nr:alpha/beta hydrolase-fold protein [Actinomadura oligospora]